MGEHCRSTRRAFVGSAAAGFFVGATKIYGQDAKFGEQKVRLLQVGSSGMGGCDCGQMLDTGDVAVVGICDVDPGHWRRKFKGNLGEYSLDGVPAFTDFREMFAKLRDSFDAVVVSTPDHTHACIALAAMRMGKHVYVQKPCCHTFEEGDMLVESARRHGVVTQMGNQHHGGVYRYEKLAKEGFWGEVTDVHCWTDRPHGYWTQGQKSLPAGEPVPPGYNWECWVGPAPMHPFSPAYINGKFRTWPDYGCGSIGDMMVHNVDAAFHALQLGLPTRLRAWTDTPVTVALPLYTTIDMRFDPTPVCPHGVNLYWYDARILPKPPPGAHPDFRFGTNGLMLTGTRASTVGAGWSGAPQVVAATGHAWGSEAKELARICSNSIKGDGPWIYHNVSVAGNGLQHYKQWTSAILAGKPEACLSRFAYSARLAQLCVLGNIAQRLSGQELRFDPVARKFVDNDAANAMLAVPARKGFECFV